MGRDEGYNAGRKGSRSNHVNIPGTLGEGNRAGTSEFSSRLREGNAPQTQLGVGEVGQHSTIPVPRPNALIFLSFYGRQWPWCEKRRQSP